MVTAVKEPMKNSTHDVEVQTEIKRETNLYSFAVESAVESAVDAFAQPLPLSALCFSLLHLLMVITALLTCQSLYTFGYCDASMFLGFRTTFTGFQEVVDTSLFYADSLVFEQKVSAIKALCSCIALFMLSLQLRVDNDATLRTVCPL
jgi:hypothetical protein